MPRVWDAYRGCLVSEEEYLSRLAEERALYKEDLEKEYEESPEGQAELRIRTKGVRLSGGVEFKGSLAEEVVSWLDSHGYKDFRYNGSLLKILPEDKSYENFVQEAIYWYARNCGMPFKDKKT